MVVPFLATIKTVLDKKGRTELLMKPLDSGIAEVGVSIKNIRVISLQPRHIGWPDCTVYARNNEREPPAPPSKQFGKDGVEHRPPVLILFDEIGYPDRSGSNISFHSGLPRNPPKA